MSAPERFDADGVRLWPEGSVSGREDPCDREGYLACVYDGDGQYCGMFRVGRGKLEFSRSAIDEMPAARVWRDCTEIWATFPTWARRRIREVLALR